MRLYLRPRVTTTKKLSPKNGRRKHWKASRWWTKSYQDPSAEKSPYNAETAKIVLDYLYLGDVEIPTSLASSVIVFANEVMVFSLVNICADILANGDNLSAENALSFYFLRIQAIEKRKAFGLSKMLQNLPLSQESGRDVLAQMSEMSRLNPCIAGES
ncbi:hypothetical protein BJ741DRAFT_574446 [Chytriomyces cf. hyalinus JEL632]|nr:hypothetical protein BJ741DRAFT_574446 [Chytriomyces cf. hyalinus JEL632]